MIFGFNRVFPPDLVEQLVPDPITARALIAERRPDVLRLLERRRVRFRPLTADQSPQMIARAENAVLMAFCRLALRHGSWGRDFHHYHNEEHILEILEGRIDRLIDGVGLDAMPLGDWFLLALFAGCHDLRQREVTEWEHGIGSNERASTEETFRILKLSGFDAVAHADIYMAIELMIAGSTFDARPAPLTAELNTADIVTSSGGALAARLDEKLDKHLPGWRDDPRVVRGVRLALIAADLDTANVAESMPELAGSAARLCREREKRSHRDLEDPASAAPVLAFLSEGQERYFFELHRFSSELGKRAFAAYKEANAPRLRALGQALRERFSKQPPHNGAVVIDAFVSLAHSV